jgi:glutamine synthetase
VTWAQRNRSDLIRIPMYKPGKEASARIELRSPDPACNPYLAFSVILAAGLEGIEQRYPLPPATETNVFELGEAERARRGIAQLPDHLGKAIELAQGSALLKRTLGEHVFQSLLANKQIEYRRFCAALTDFELKTYLPLL